jgi:hypothetical protein
MEEWREQAEQSQHGFTSCEVRLVRRCGPWRVAPRTAQAQGVRAMHVFGRSSSCRWRLGPSPGFQVMATSAPGERAREFLASPLTGVFLERADKVLFGIWRMFAFHSDLFVILRVFVFVL